MNAYIYVCIHMYICVCIYIQIKFGFKPGSIFNIHPTPSPNQATYGCLCGMPASGHAVGCGACETPELWRDAAGLCARVRACAGAAESLPTYTHIYLSQFLLLALQLEQSRRVKGQPPLSRGPPSTSHPTFAPPFNAQHSSHVFFSLDHVNMLS